MIEKLIEKLSRPKVMLLSMALLWAGLLITNYTIDQRLYEVQDFINDNVKVYKTVYFDTGLNTTPPDINMSAIPEVYNGP